MKTTVCIDAGHGIETPGKRSPDGTYLEHEFNLDVARRVRDILTAAGIDVVMTREDVHDVTLSRRCDISNAASAGAFLSIHTNAAAGDGWHSANGWSAHILARGGNAERLAEHIRARALPALGCADRGVQVNNYQVLRETDAPAVLVEHGFHTNRDEVEKLKSDAYRALCAQSDARGILDFFGIPAAGMNKITAVANIRQPVYTESGAADKGRYIDKGDVCEIGEITPNLLISVTYPTQNGPRQAFIRGLEGFRV